MNLKALRKYILVFSDAFTLSLSVLVGWALAELSKMFLFPGVQSMEWNRAVELVPVLYGLPLLYIVISSGLKGHYNNFRPYWDEYYELLKIILIAAMMIIIYLYITKSHFSRLWFFYTWFSALLFLPTGRLMAKKAMIKWRIWYVPTVVIGAGKNAIESAEALDSDPMLGLQVIALLDFNKNASQCSSKFRVIDIDENIENTLEDLGDPYILLAFELEDYIEHKDLIEKISLQERNMCIVPPLRGLPLVGTEVLHVFRHETLILRTRNNLARRSQRIIKRAFDVIVSSILSVLFLPFLIIISILIRQDGGNVFFGHQRVGRKGQRFSCFKFRTMCSNADKILQDFLDSDSNAKDEWERDFKLKNDPRVTRIGRFLRKTSLDELPQLLNVLKGDMSLVGPRPIIDKELERYGDMLPFYLEVRPGVTGLWQVSGRNDLDYQSRVDLDVWYSRNWSIWNDIIILLKTFPIVIRSNGAY